MNQFLSAMKPADPTPDMSTRLSATQRFGSAADGLDEENDVITLEASFQQEESHSTLKKRVLYVYILLTAMVWYDNCQYMFGTLGQVVSVFFIIYVAILCWPGRIGNWVSQDRLQIRSILLVLIAMISGYVSYPFWFLFVADYSYTSDLCIQVTEFILEEMGASTYFGHDWVDAMNTCLSKIAPFRTSFLIYVVWFRMFDGGASKGANLGECLWDMEDKDPVSDESDLFSHNLGTSTSTADYKLNVLRRASTLSSGSPIKHDHEANPKSYLSALPPSSGTQLTTIKSVDSSAERSASTTRVERSGSPASEPSNEKGIQMGQQEAENEKDDKSDKDRTLSIPNSSSASVSGDYTLVSQDLRKRKNKETQTDEKRRTKEETDGGYGIPDLGMCSSENDPMEYPEPTRKGSKIRGVDEYRKSSYFSMFIDSMKTFCYAQRKIIKAVYHRIVSPHKYPRFMPSFRRRRFWKHMAMYFPIKLTRTAKLDPTKQYVFGYHPHGVISVGAFINFATYATGFDVLFPGVDVRVLTLALNFKFPFIRECLLAIGLNDVSRESITNNIEAGRSVMLVPGGAAESINAAVGNNSLVLEGRKGFVKLAIRTGASLVPVYSFGETDIFEAVKLTGKALKIQQWLQRKLGVAILLIHGRSLTGGLMRKVFGFNKGIFPLRTPIHSVVGNPIDVPKIKRDEDITNEMVNEVHKKYMIELERIHREWVGVYEQEKADRLASLTHSHQERKTALADDRVYGRLRKQASVLRIS